MQTSKNPKSYGFPTGLQSIYQEKIREGNIELLSHLVRAALLSSVIGLERERRNWAASFRTHMLVCGEVSLMMLVSAFGFAGAPELDDVQITLSHATASELATIRTRLTAMPGVHECRNGS